MGLVRSWLGQALRATGAAVMVPVAILVALSLTGIGGTGLGDLGSLSQIVGGPDVAGTDVAVNNSDEEISQAFRQLAAAAPSDVVDLGTGGGGGGGDTGGGGGGDNGGGDNGGGDNGGGDNGGGDNGGGDNGGGDNGGGDNGGGDNGGGGGGNPEPPEPPEPGVVEDLGDTVDDVTSETPVGPTVEEAIDGLVEVCGQLNCP